MEKYDITDYLKDDKELQKAVIEEFLKEIAELKAENKELAHYLACMTERRNRANTCLQEIKAIVKKNISYQDTDSTTRAMNKILNLITKAEEE